MRRNPMPRFVPILAALTTAALATAADRAVLEQKLGAKYRLSSVNAEGDFVIKGTTLVLRRGGFTGGADTVTCIHEYKDGKISLTGASKAACTGTVRMLSKIPGINLIPGVGGVNQTAQGAAPTTRPFVAGEKLYMTKIEVVKDDIHLTLISELVNMVRYRAEIRFHKAATLEVPEAENLIAEVLGVGAGGGGAAATASTQPAPAAAPAPAPVAAAPPATALAPIPAPTAPPADAPLAPIAPPPPPPDQPAGAVSPGMTVDQVVAMLGQPNTIADLGSKKIYSYPSQKVTFIDGKVAPTADSSTSTAQSVDLLPYEIGLGVLIVGAAAFLLGRRNRPAGMAPPAPPLAAMPPPAYPPAPPQPAWSPQHQASRAASPQAPQPAPPQPAWSPQHQASQAAPPQAPQPAPPQAAWSPQHQASRAASPQAPQPAPPQPAWSPQHQASQAAPPQAAPVNPIKRLDELEKLMDLGVLSREEFEREKDKLRNG